MQESKRLLKRAARNVFRVLEEPEFWTPAFCRAFFEWCDVQAYEAPESVLVRGQLGLELAKKTGDRHALAKGHAAMASAYRKFGVRDRCDAEIATALRLARSCSCCLAETHRRHGGILIFQSRFAEARTCLDTSIAHFTNRNDEDGVGRALISRGVAQWRLGKIGDALEDERQALRLLGPETPAFFYLAALTNTAHILAKAEDAHFAQAEPLLNALRAHLRGRDGLTAVRICLSWTHGLILVRLGERKRGLQMLRKVRKRLLHRRQDAEVIAITADIATLYCDTRQFRYIRELVRDSLATLRNVSDTRPLLEHVLAAAEQELCDTRTRLAALRAAVTVAMPTLHTHSSADVLTAP